MLDFLGWSSNSHVSFYFFIPILLRDFFPLFSSSFINFNFHFGIFNFQDFILVFWIFLSTVACSCIIGAICSLTSRNKLEILKDVFLCPALPQFPQIIFCFSSSLSFTLEDFQEWSSVSFKSNTSKAD